MEQPKYVHGYHATEQERLHKQAGILAQMTYEYFNFEGIETMLEMGCGTGGQTEIILQKYPRLQLVSVDISAVQVAKAKENLAYLGNKIHFEQGDITNLAYPNESFEAVFICWVLEHTPHPDLVLKEAFRLLKPGGKIFITEVHNQSMATAPHKLGIEKYMRAFNNYQIEIGGHPHIGIELGNLAAKAGFLNIKKRSLHQWQDESDIAQKALIVSYFKELYLTAADDLLANNKITEQDLRHYVADFDALIADADGVYYYSPIQLEAQKMG